MGSYKYVFNEASMIGDDAYHATSAVNYTATKEMRMAATIYVADINDENIGPIMKDYTQKYPPKGDFEFLLSLAGSHWRKNSDEYKLPQ